MSRMVSNSNTTSIATGAGGAPEGGKRPIHVTTGRPDKVDKSDNPGSYDGQTWKSGVHGDGLTVSGGNKKPK